MNIIDSNTKTTLLLNNAWQPITTITARAAFLHLLKKNVTAIDKNSNVFHSLESWNNLADYFDDQPSIRSAKATWPIPTIIVVTSRFFKRPKKKKLSLAETAKIYEFTCQYCLNKFSLKDLTIDHILPKSKGGQDVHENRTLSCQPCNTRKGSKYPFPNNEGKQVLVPNIPSLILNTNKIREEWMDFLQIS